MIAMAITVVKTLKFMAVDLYPRCKTMVLAYSPTKLSCFQGKCICHTWSIWVLCWKHTSNFLKRVESDMHSK